MGLTKIVRPRGSCSSEFATLTRLIPGGPPGASRSFRAALTIPCSRFPDYEHFGPAWTLTGALIRLTSRQSMNLFPGACAATLRLADPVDRLLITIGASAPLGFQQFTFFFDTAHAVKGLLRIHPIAFDSIVTAILAICLDR